MFRNALFLVTTILLGLLLQRSPLLMTTTAPTTKAAWADGPMKLIATPEYTTKKTDIFIKGATHMCLLHNAIIRGYNTIWQQALRVPDADKAGFVGYCLAWFRFVKSHHDDEEQNLFPRVEGVLGDKDIWKGTHEEHESFLPGLVEFQEYLSGLPTPSALSGSKLRSIMSSFSEAFENHFHSEISTIASFGEHPSCPKEGTPEAETAALNFKTWGKSTVSKAGMTDVVPFFLMNLDKTYEEGMWANWPPMPAPIRWGMINLAGSWHGGWWKFASCGSDGMPRELYALQFPEVEGEKKGDAPEANL